MKIFSLIPCLFDETGHHFVYHKTFSDVLKINNWKHLKYIPKKSILKDLSKDWEKKLVLHQGSSKKSLWRNFFKPLLNFFPFFNILWKIKKNEETEKAIFIEYFTISHLLALYLAFLFTKTKCYLWLLYRTDLDQVVLKGKVHRVLHKKISKIIGKKNLIFFTDSELLSEQLATFFEKKFNVLPIPHIKFFDKKIDLDKKKSMQLWWPGGSIREEKGLKYIIDLSEKLSSERHITLVVAEAAKSFLFDNCNIKYVNTNLSFEEYNDLMVNSDIILLPYLSELYKFRTSGIFVEAIALNKVVVTTENTWMAYELKKFDLKELLINWNDKNYIKDIMDIFFSKSINAKLEQMAKFYRNFHSLENFAKILKLAVQNSEDL